MGRTRQSIVEIMAVHLCRQPNLMEIARTLGGVRPRFGFTECGQEHPGQNRNDRDYDQ
jgi:hypothetical protein